MPRAARQGRNTAIPSSYKDQGPGNYELFYVYFSGETDSSFSFSIDYPSPGSAVHRKHRFHSNPKDYIFLTLSQASQSWCSQ